MLKYFQQFAWIIVFTLIFISVSDIIKHSDYDYNTKIMTPTLENTQDIISVVSSTFKRGNEPVTFNNVSSIANITHFRSDSFAWGDYNNDGYLDFLARGNISVGTRLFRNNGPPNWNFTDISEDINLTGSGLNPHRGYPIWGDYDNDGYLDFFVAGDHDQLWRNNGPPGWNFTNVTTAAGNLDDLRPSEAAAWGDYDRDGYLDIYVNSWRDALNNKFRDILWHNNGDGTFTDVSSQAGIYSSNTPAYDSPPFAGMGVAWGDYNNDGWLDIYVCNYLLAPNYLWRNNHDGTFTDIAVEQCVAGKADFYEGQGPYYGHTAGAGWADFNNNGNLDLWISNLAHKDDERSGYGRGYFCDDSMMLLNNGPPFFEFGDIRNRTGIPIIPVGTIQDSQWKDEDYFGVTWGDYDNDGDIDLWIPQVKTYHSWAYSYLWRNNNDETFNDVSDSVGIKVWSNTGAVWGDYDNDGFVDLLTEGTVPYQGKRETRLFRNNGNSNNWLQLRLKGVVSNSAAIGARIYLKSGSVTQTREIGGDAGGHGFQNSFNVEFGLGKNTVADEIKIIWPSGIAQVFKNVQANQIINITEDTSGPKINSVWVDKYGADEDEILTFDATTSGSPLNFEWDLDNDGIIDRSSTGVPPKYYYSYEKAGNYTAKLWAWNNDFTLGWVESTEFITINNVPPTANAGGDIEVWEDEIFVFDASSTIDTESDVEYLEYNWTFDDGNYSSWLNEPIIEYYYSEREIYNVELKVRDDDFDVATDTIKVTVKNKPPSVKIFSNKTVAEDSPIMFSVISQDTPSDIPYLVYRWDFGDGNDTYWMVEKTINHTYQRNGTYKVTCYIHDDDGLHDINYSSVSITVFNVPPKCYVEGNIYAYEDQIVYLNGTANDTYSDLGTLKFLWDFADGTSGEWLETGEQNITHIYTKKGLYKVKLIVKDDNEVQCTKIVEITVKNVKPQCEVTGDINTVEDEIVHFICLRSWDSESDMDSLEYSWDFGIPGLPNTAWNLSSRFNYSYEDEGEYTVLLSVRDDDGDTGNASFKITVRNVVPKAKFFISSSTVSEDEIIEVDATESEDTKSDLDTLNYTWNFGDKSPIMYGPFQSHSYNRSGNYKIVLSVKDDNGKENSVKKDIKVNNQPPTAVIIVSTFSTYPESIILFNGIDSYDTISDKTKLRFDWTFGDKTQATGIMVTHSYSSSGKFKVKLTVTDDDGSQDFAEIWITVNELSNGKSEKDTVSNETILALETIISICIVILLLILLMYLKKPSKVEPTDLEEAKEPQDKIEDDKNLLKADKQKAEDRSQWVEKRKKTPEHKKVKRIKSKKQQFEKELGITETEKKLDIEDALDMNDIDDMDDMVDTNDTNSSEGIDVT